MKTTYITKSQTITHLITQPQTHFYNTAFPIFIASSYDNDLLTSFLYRESTDDVVCLTEIRFLSSMFGDWPRSRSVLYKQTMCGKSHFGHFPFLERNKERGEGILRRPWVCRVSRDSVERHVRARRVSDPAAVTPAASRSP